MNIIYSDRELAVIIKPVGMDSEHQVPAAIMEKLGGEVFPIHRLDLNVGGVMVYARTKFAAAQLSKLVQEGQLVKEYRALVHGTPPESGILEYFLGGGIAISWQSMVLDYVGCNMMTGLCGLGCGRKGGWLWGPVLAHLGRAAVLVLSGGLLWYMYMPEEFLGLAMVNPWVYSLLYNGVLSAVVLAVDLAALYLLGRMDLGQQKILTKQY